MNSPDIHIEECLIRILFDPNKCLEEAIVNGSSRTKWQLSYLITRNICLSLDCVVIQVFLSLMY